MPGFRSALSSAVYHGVTRPGIRAVGKYFNNLKKKYETKLKLKMHPPGPGGYDPNRRARILNTTRGRMATSGKLFSKSTVTGLKRRQNAAKAAPKYNTRLTRKNNATIAPGTYLPKYAPKSTSSGPRKYPGVGSSTPKTTVNTSTTTPSKVPVPPKAKRAQMSHANIKASRGVPRGSVAAAVASSKTHGQLRRKITGQAVREVSKEHLGTTGDYKARRKAAADSLRAYRKVNPSALKKRVRQAKDSRLKTAAEQILSKRKA